VFQSVAIENKKTTDGLSNEKKGKKAAGKKKLRFFPYTSILRKRPPERKNKIFSHLFLHK
jgi:hypothetical protein